MDTGDESATACFIVCLLFMKNAAFCEGFTPYTLISPTKMTIYFRTVRSTNDNAWKTEKIFSETGLKNSRKIGHFFREFVPENPAKFDFFSATYQKPCLRYLKTQINASLQLGYRFKPRCSLIEQLQVKYWII